MGRNDGLESKVAEQHGQIWRPGDERRAFVYEQNGHCRHDKRRRNGSHGAKRAGGGIRATRRHLPRVGLVAAAARHADRGAAVASRVARVVGRGREERSARHRQNSGGEREQRGHSADRSHDAIANCRFSTRQSAGFPRDKVISLA